jgi:hypothetical protein
VIRSVLLLSWLVACNGDDSDTDPADTDTDPPCTDADEDEVCLESGDCDDTNELVHEGAPDVPYNDRDEDCDGADLVDVDGDGHIGATAGGDDCNDGNPEVYPEAPEECYASLDMNCDGLYGGDDCDFDGVPKTEDCDDEDATIYPGAPDTWYDGIDSDCGGGSDYDQDGDGDDSADYGGSDCDDLDPLVGGALPEVWDGVDQDCDGIVDAIDNTDALAGWDAAAGVGDAFWGHTVTILSDWDGDGSAEIASGDMGKNDYVGGVYVISSGSATGNADDVAVAMLDGTAEFEIFGYATANAGDLDGDGLDDLLVGAPQYGTGAALLYLAADLVIGGAFTSGDAHTTMTAGTFAGSTLASIGDLDADGKSEILVGTDLYGYTSFAVYAGADAAAGGSLSTGDAMAFGSSTGKLGGAAAGGLDLGGDDLPDVVVAQTSGSSKVHVLDGQDLVGGVIVDLTATDAMTGGSWLGATMGLLEDVDRDGHNEIMVADPSTVALDGFDYGGTVYVVDADDFVSDTPVADLAMFTVQGPVGNSFLRVPSRSADHDLDGAPDLLVGHPGNRDILGMSQSTYVTSGYGAIYAYTSATVAAGGTALVTDAAATYSSTIDDACFGMGLDAAPIDAADAIADLAIGAPANTTGKLYVFLSGW